MGTTQEVLNNLRGLDGPTMLALVGKFPGQREGLDAVLQGKKRIVLEDMVRILVDQNGRCISSHLDVISNVCDENRDFRVAQPEIYEAILERFVEFFPEGTKFVSVSEFEDRAKAAMEQLAQNELIANLTNRAHLPLPFPQHDASGNYGQSLQGFFLPAVKRAYESQFPDRKFYSYRDGELAGKVSVIPDVGHDKLLAAMAAGPGVAWYFPHPLQGFSIQADIEAMKVLLSHNLLLTGAIEPALGIVGFTEEMAGSFNTPGYDCSAVSWQSVDYSLDFGAVGDKLDFDGTARLARAGGSYSGGLLFLT